MVNECHIVSIDFFKKMLLAFFIVDRIEKQEGTLEIF